MKPNHSRRFNWHRAFRDLRHLPRHSYDAIRDHLDILPGLVFILCAVISGHWAATTLEHIVGSTLEGQTLPAHGLAIFLITVPSFLLFSFLTWIYRHAFRELHLRASFRSDASPKEVLVWFVSIQDALKEVPPTGPVDVVGVRLTREPGRLLADANALKARYEDDVSNKRKPSSWNWEMLLRAVDPHASTLRRLYLIGSGTGNRPGASGSHSQLELCRKFLQPYIPSVEINNWEQPVDFEDVVAIDENLRELIAKESTEGTGIHTICVDVTGGQKPTSIAGAIATLNNKVTVQYVQTGGEKHAHCHDLVFYSPVDHAQKS